MEKKPWNIILYILLGLNIITIITFWLIGSARSFSLGFGFSLIAIGRLLGLSAVFLVLLQVLLIGRTIWVEQLFGLDKLSRLHHRSGTYAIYLILLHPIFITAGYAINSKTAFFSQLIIFITTWKYVLLAALALLLFAAIVIISLVIVRNRLKYETWYYVHVFVYAAILLAYFHQLAWGGDFITKGFATYWIILYLFVLLNLLIFRVARPLINMATHDFIVQRIERETHNTVSVYITGKNLESFPLHPGQFMIFRFFAKGFWQQAHPFSASGFDLYDKKYIRITVKASGDFTSEMHKLPAGTKVLIDGPHGVFTSRFAKHEKFLFIAGGVGITPIRSLIEGCAINKEDALLLYANKARKDIIFEKELENMEKKYPDIKMVHILSDEKEWKGEIGYIDNEKIFRYCPDIKHREIYLCGPLPMMDSILIALKELQIPKQNIHYEKFSL